MIHERAVVSPGARLGANVSIGAFSVIGEDVEIQDGSWIGPHVIVTGRTRIGRNNRIHQFCSIGDAPQHIAYGGEPTALTIGDNNVIREYCTLNRGTEAGGGETVIGNDNFIMAYVHIAHDCRIGDRTIFANGASLAGHVVVGDFAVLGGFTLVHQFCRIGTHSITGVNSVCLKDVAPYLIVAGHNATTHGVNVKGLRRRGFDSASIAQLRRAYRTLFRSRRRLEEAIGEVEAGGAGTAQVAELVAFLKTSTRGVIR